ncbi:hypothetical protein V8D89_001062 [Ganoderma adspersum]
MPHSPTHSHAAALHIAIPTATTDSVAQAPSERTGPQSASFTNPDVVLGPNGDSTNTLLQHDADNDPTQSHALMHTDTGGHGHPFARSALNAVPSTPIQSGVEGVPSTPTSPRASRRTTRRGSLFSAGEDHDGREGDRKGDFIAEAAAMLGVIAGHFIAGHIMHEEPSSENGDHDDEEKEDA